MNRIIIWGSILYSISKTSKAVKEFPKCRRGKWTYWGFIFR